MEVLLYGRQECLHVRLSIINSHATEKIHVKIHRIEVSWRDYSPKPQIIQNQSIHSDQQHSQKLQLKKL